MIESLKEGAPRMRELGNPRREKFAKLTATGHKRADAYIGAGYHTKSRDVATKRGVALFTATAICGPQKNRARGAEHVSPRQLTVPQEESWSRRTDSNR